MMQYNGYFIFRNEKICYLVGDDKKSIITDKNGIEKLTDSIF